VNVNVGDKVGEDDQIATLEAMKMEMPIVSPVAGTVKEIKVSAGQEVEADTVLAIIE
jgi:biotin carboxyl carrier protein